MTTSSSLASAFRSLSSAAAKAVGKPASFILALGLVLLWAVVGPMFHFSDAWQLVINTGTTIVTFLMVFLIQNAQNRDSEAIQIKLDELLRAIDNANNQLINIESLDEEAMEVLRKQFLKKRTLDSSSDQSCVAEGVADIQASSNAEISNV